MPQAPTQADLEAYLDEALSVEEMARIERALRDDPTLAAQLSTINARRDAGLHSLGEIWRRHRLTCPTRDQLGSYLLKALDADVAGFVDFHVNISGCRACLANLEDLKSRQTDEPAAVTSRRQEILSIPAPGHLRR